MAIEYALMRCFHAGLRYHRGDHSGTEGLRDPPAGLSTIYRMHYIDKFD